MFGSNKNIIFDTSFIDKDEEKGYEQLQEIENKWSYKYASAYKIRESH